MNRTSAVIIGAGQAGLAVSYLLTEAGVDHVVLDRGHPGESWRSRRWDSLHMLTPNWMSRLPGWSYRGNDPEGFMSAAAVAEYLGQYAHSFSAPVVSGAEVHSVRWQDDSYVVVSAAGCWAAAAVVIATGHAAEPNVPAVAAKLDPSILQLTPDRYRNPSDVPPGGVLIVGGSATGVQLADELAAAGRHVLLAVGRHTRMPRRYRGMDIMWWLDAMGIADRRLVSGGPPRRPETSLQLIGSSDHREVDLPALNGRGVTLTGRLTGAAGHTVGLSHDLPIRAAMADAKLDALLDRIDLFAAGAGLNAEIDPPTRPTSSADASAARIPSEVNLRSAGVRSVVWATGYRRRYPWLHVPVLDEAGEIRHIAGRTPLPGLCVVGMRWQTGRSSTLLDGVRHDAQIVVDHLVNQLVQPDSQRSAS